MASRQHTAPETETDFSIMIDKCKAEPNWMARVSTFDETHHFNESGMRTNVKEDYALHLAVTTDPIGSLTYQLNPMISHQIHQYTTNSKPD